MIEFNEPNETGAELNAPSTPEWKEVQPHLFRSELERLRLIYLGQIYNDLDSDHTKLLKCLELLMKVIQLLPEGGFSELSTEQAESLPPLDSKEVIELLNRIKNERN